ncbi:unnamed protein product [Closterium sp. NIES-53]
MWTRRSPLSRDLSPEPRRSCYRADGPFHLVLRSRVPPLPVLPQPSESSLTVLYDPLSDYLRASHPVVSRVLFALVTHPTAPLLCVSTLVTTVAGFASSHRLDYASHLVSGIARSPSIGGVPVFPLENLEDRQFELGFLAVAVPYLCAMLLAPEGDPNTIDIPIPRNHAEEISGPWASYWIAAEEAEMASYRSTSAYIDTVPPLGTNIVSGMWLYKVMRSPGSPPVFKARYVARGFSQHEAVDFFQTFAPTPKMTTLRVLLHFAAQRDYELHSLDFSIAFLQGSLHEQIWLRCPPDFIGSFPLGTKWHLGRPVYGLHQAPCEWHVTLRTTLAVLDFFPSSADPSLFVRRGLTPFFVLVYVDNLVFATPDRHALASVKEELQRRHTCTDLGELQRWRSRIWSSRSSHRSASNSPRVAKYVASTSGMGLVLGWKQPVTLTGYSDSSWANDTESLRSTKGYCFCLGIGVVSWRSPPALSVSSSNCEAEVYTAAMAAQELCWLSFLLTDLGERPRSPPVLFADNRSDQNGIAERRIGLIMEVARTSMIHAAAPHFVWPFAVRYTAHQLNLWPHVSLPETLPTVRWTGKVGDASAFRVWGALSLVCDTIASKLTPRTLRFAFLGFPTDAPPWQFYYPCTRRVLSSHDVTFDESVCFYRLHPHASHPVPLAPLFLVPVPPSVDPLPPQVLLP